MRHRRELHGQAWIPWAAVSALLIALAWGVGWVPRLMPRFPRSLDQAPPWLDIAGHDQSNSSANPTHLFTNLVLQTSTVDSAVTFRAHTVGLGPRRLGLITYQSFQEVAVTSAHMEVRPRAGPGGRGKPEGPMRLHHRLAGARDHSDLLGLARSALDPVIGLVRDREPASPMQGDRLFRQRYPVSRVAMQGLELHFLLAPRRTVRLTAEKAVTFPGSLPTLVFHRLRIQDAYGRALTAEEASWQSESGVIATGPYQLTRGRRASRGTSGRFRLNTQGRLAFLGRARVKPVVADPMMAILNQGDIRPEPILGGWPALAITQLVQPGGQMHRWDAGAQQSGSWLVDQRPSASLQPKTP